MSKETQNTESNSENSITVVYGKDNVCLGGDYSSVICYTGVNGLQEDYSKIQENPTVNSDLDDVKSSNNFTLTYDELFSLLKEAYRNGYATYEMADAGLEPYDAEGYARWVLLGFK